MISLTAAPESGRDGTLHSGCQAGLLLSLSLCFLPQPAHWQPAFLSDSQPRRPGWQAGSRQSSLQSSLYARWPGLVLLTRGPGSLSTEIPPAIPVGRPTGWRAGRLAGWLEINLLMSRQRCPFVSYIFGPWSLNRRQRQRGGPTVREERSTDEASERPTNQRENERRNTPS